MSFGKKDDIAGVQTNSSAAFLGKGTKVVGALHFSGPVEIDGEVEGEIHAKDKVTIGENAVLRAKIFGSEIIIRGTVQGEVVATKSLSLKKPAKILGNIASPALAIEEGVMFEGKCSMPVQAAVATPSTSSQSTTAQNKPAATTNQPQSVSNHKTV